MKKYALIATALLGVCVAPSAAQAKVKPLAMWQAQQRANQVALNWPLPGGTVATQWSPPTATDCSRFTAIWIDCTVNVQANTVYHYWWTTQTATDSSWCVGIVAVVDGHRKW
jgi:hypothetical protein